MDLVSDTNVWYDISGGRRDPAALKAKGHRLLATRVSFIEIASRLSEHLLRLDYRGSTWPRVAEALSPNSQRS